MPHIEKFYQASNFIEFLKHSKEICFSKSEQIYMKNNNSYGLKRIRRWAFQKIENDIFTVVLFVFTNEKFFKMA